LLQELVNCITKDKPDVIARHCYVFCSHLPPRWKVEAELANLLVSIGVVKSALDIFLRLQLWEEVIMCYNLLHLRHKVRTGSLLCMCDISFKGSCVEYIALFPAVIFVIGV